MTYAVANAAIRQRFETQWGATSAVQFPGVKFVEPDAKWVRLNIAQSASDWASMGDPGNNVERNLGQVTLQIFTPKGTGEGDALELADQARAVFRSWQDVASGVRFVVPPYSRVIGNGDKWYQINVVAPFRFDDFT